MSSTCACSGDLDKLPSGYDDFLHMPELSVDTFLKNIQVRYKNDIYYTNIGDVCISVNPNMPTMSIYGPDYIELYSTRTLYKLPPHIFSVARAGHQKVFEQNIDCSIIITGETGSGKTEASKLLLLYIDYVNHKNGYSSKTTEIVNVENLMIQSNCILEAFGNARTLCNNNSSRFGKYTEISFVYDALPKGFHYDLSRKIQYSYGTIYDYLLEKCRVISQKEGERNFHVFYQLLSSFQKLKKSDQDLAKLVLDDDAQSYRYLNGSSKSRVTEQDKIDFGLVYDSLLKVGFRVAEIQSIYKVLTSILVLGNIQFRIPESYKNPDFSRFITDESRIFLNNFCHLLKLDVKTTVKTLCSRQIRTPMETVCKIYTNSEAIFGRDALAKAIYQHLFGYILKRINQFLENNKPTNQVNEEDAISEDGGTRTNKIGILDIYGFEVFNEKPNGFEQFLINYCNERLHQLFIDLILRKEQRLYEQEDINWKMVVYDDNISVCQLMDHPTNGIFALLDEACLSPQPITDQDLLEALNKHLKDSECFQSRVKNPSLKNLDLENDFIIQHFAGDVHYSIDGFIEKNLDQLYYDYKEMLLKIQNKSIQKIFEEITMNKLDCYKRPTTASLQFRRSLGKLISRLSNQQQLYVRCIKPCEELYSVKDRFDAKKVRHQIQYLGLVENAKIRKAGFWRQFAYQQFVQHYKMLLDKPLIDQIFTDIDGDDDADQRACYRPICEKILSQIPTVKEKDFDPEHPKRFAFGKTILFLRDSYIVETLETLRLQYLQNLILQIQTRARMNFAIEHFERLKLSKLIFEEFCRLKKLDAINRFIEEFEKYAEKFKTTCLNKPAEILEFYDLKPFQPNENLFKGPLLNQNDLYSKYLPEWISYLNFWSILLAFSSSYWNEKALKIKASSLFRGKKSDWGQSRPRWLGNYLIHETETEQYHSFRELFEANPLDFSTVLFSSYIVRINSWFLEKIGAIVMNQDTLFLVNIDNFSYRKLISIDHIQSISLTNGSDQLVVLHWDEIDHENDIVFTFCSLQTPTMVTSRSSKGTVTPSTPVSDNKLGEFIAVIITQNEKLPGRHIINLTFSNRIEFYTKDGIEYRIRATEKDHNPSLLQRFRNFHLISYWFTVENLYRSFYRLCLQEEQRLPHLSKKIRLRKVSNRELLLVHER